MHSRNSCFEHQDEQKCVFYLFTRAERARSAICNRRLFPNAHTHADVCLFLFSLTSLESTQLSLPHFFSLSLYLKIHNDVFLGSCSLRLGPVSPSSQTWPLFMPGSRMKARVLGPRLRDESFTFSLSLSRLGSTRSVCSRVACACVCRPGSLLMQPSRAMTTLERETIFFFFFSNRQEVSE